MDKKFFFLAKTKRQNYFKKIESEKKLFFFFFCSSTWKVQAVFRCQQIFLSQAKKMKKKSLKLLLPT